ncbi:MAG TPA: DUF2723 domain-containing protein, partial [Chloroflexota bacterium]|nr:DUF2723 domain-containing protein [Chloroflexota bacterium]
MGAASSALPGHVGRALPWSRPLTLPGALLAVPAVTVGALYVREAAPSVGGGNTGEFQVMAHQLGIAHPPSYPLFLLLGKVVSLVPLGGDVAWRINLANALLGAAALLLLSRLPAALGVVGAGASAAALAGAVAAVVLGAAPRLWTLSVEAEVFTLHLFLVLAFWLALLQRRTYLAAFLAGLGLANHRTFLFIAGAGALHQLLLGRVAVPRPRTLLFALALFALGLTPYLYVLRGLVMPVAYFSPLDVHRLSRGEVWYVLQGNASGETAGGRVVLDLLANRDLLADRIRWLLGHLSTQLSLIPGARLPLLAAAVAGLFVALRRAPRFVATALLGALGAALFAMAYAKYPDADRYLLPLEALLALGLGTLAASLAAALASLLPGAGLAARVAGAAAGLALAVSPAFSLGVLSAQSDLTRGGYVHHTIHNLEGVERGAVVCTWWSSAWGLWYAQRVDGVRPDVTVIPKGPDDCVRDVLPQEFGRRAVYLPALTDAARRSEFVFFPSRDLWLAVARGAPLGPGSLAKGPDDRIYLVDGGRRRWVPSLEVFAAHGF